MEFTSYDELLKQVDNLKVENSNLRKELADNCNHLTKLGNEASTMKEVLTILNDRMDGESEQVSTEDVTEEIPDNRQAVNQPNENELETHNPGSIQAQLAHLERERTRILQDIEFEEKEKQWFLTCMERINQQLFQLSHMNGQYSTQADSTLKQQFERDAECLRESMHQKLGTRSETRRREEARIRSVCLLEKEIEKLYQQQDSDRYLCDYDDEEHANEKAIADLTKEENSEQKESDDMKMSSKMTTSATQTVDMFSSEITSPPLITEQDFSNLANIYHGSWPVDKVLWHSGPSSLGDPKSIHSFNNQDTGSVASFKSSSGSGNGYCARSSSQQLGTKVEMVYSLLSMLGSHDKDDMSIKLLNMSSSVDSCVAMRQSGCLPLLVELLHSDDKDGDAEQRRPSRETRQRASQALHNIVHSHPDDKRGRREARVLRLLEQIRDYCSSLRDSDSGSDEEQASPEATNADRHPVPAMAMLMKLSFDEEHRHAMCQLGGLQAIAELVQADYETHGNLNDQYCITLRRYAGMALTNLTFGDGTNKALLCSMRPFMRALVAQLHSPSEDLRQVIASVLRNLSWRADQASKKTLREVGAVATLMRAAMDAKKEPTLKSILSALWNLSAHCSMNKADICAVDGSLAFLVSTLTYKSPSNTHAIVENGGGILRNISSHVAVREDYRVMLRQHNCLQILLQHLRSPSLTIVSNACGTLWNLSARCTEDQQSLWDMGAVGMLRNLVHSKHKMISMGSSAALKNLLSAKPGGLASGADKSMKSSVPSLLVRKQKALEAELDQSLSETCENLDSPKTSPTHHRSSEVEPKLSGPRGGRFLVGGRAVPLTVPYQPQGRMYHSVGGQLPQRNVSRSESKDSIVSTQSDSSHDRLHNLNILLRHRQRQGICHDELPDTAIGAAPDVLESRIQYVMQEVTRQIALENEIIKNDCGTKGSCYLKPSSTPSTAVENLTLSTPNSGVGISNRNTSTPVFDSSAAMFEKYSNLSSMVDNLNLDDGGDSNYQPVDFSLKYSDEPVHFVENNRLPKEPCGLRVVPKINNHISGKLASTNVDGDQKHGYGKSRLKSGVDWQGSNRRSCDAAYKLNSEPLMYTSYAETDLDGPDQPTNFSLKYTEDTDTTDTFRAPEPQEGTPYFGHEYGSKGPSFHDDTMMTYCTEGTPLNFSTATSLTDLHDLKDGSASTGIEEVAEDKVDDDGSGSVHDDQRAVKNRAESSTGSATENGRVGLGQGLKSEIIDKICDGSGVSSNCIFSNDDQRVSDDGRVRAQSCAEDSAAKADVDARSNHIHEVKTVTFGDDQYAEETPLMFSRCSSLGSLSSFDQHSIHDDRSSVISDFSRRASEVVSPSDLPDSPGQTLPPSPRPLRAPVSFVARIPKESSSPSSKIARPAPCKRNVSSEPKTSVFEDAPQVFLVEGTPLQFSKATSLSSLPSCDEGLENNAEDSAYDEGAEGAAVNSNCMPKTEESPSSDEFQEADKISSDGRLEESAEKIVSADLSENEDNGDDILAACINSAMPNNTRESKLKHNNTKLYSKLNILNSGLRLRGSSSIPVKANNLKLGCAPPSPQGSSASGTSAAAVMQHKQNNQFLGGSGADPSPNVNKCSRRSSSSGKTSEYSRSGCRDDSSSDTSSVFDDDPEKILAQCIRSGMPKAGHLDRGKHAGNLLERKADGSSGSSEKDNYNKTQFGRAFSQTSRVAVTSSRKFGTNTSAEDEVTVFAVEGTPINFSNATSLSSLTVDSTDGAAAVKGENVRVKTDKLCAAADEMKHYAYDSTPSWFSRGSSLSSLGAATSDVSRRNEHHDAKEVRRQSYLVEDTPVCFSQNSSLSSLSVESLCVEPSAQEQALLEECISTGMPKGHAADARSEQHKRLPAPASRLPCAIGRGGHRAAALSRNGMPPKREDQGGVHIGSAAERNVEEGVDDSVTKNATDTAVADDRSSAAAAEDAKDVDTDRRIALATGGGEAEDFSLPIVDTTMCVPAEGDGGSDDPMQISAQQSGKQVEAGSLLIQMEATKVVGEFQKDTVKGLHDEMEQSLVSQSSELIDNVNPPSVMGDLLSSSMVSSGGGVSVGNDRCGSSSDPKVVGGSFDQLQAGKGRCAAAASQRSKAAVPELVMRALGDGAGGGGGGKPSSMACSQESVSLRSGNSATCDMIDNVMPPSVMEDLDMASSTYSVCSIVSEVADTRSDVLSADDSSLGSDVFKCLKPVVAMAELYARDGGNMVTSGRSCQSVSEIIENVNPPSTLMEITDTIYDATEVATDTLENNNDTDVEDDLPTDPEPPPQKGAGAERSTTVLRAADVVTGRRAKAVHADEDLLMHDMAMTDVENNNEEAVDGGQHLACYDVNDDFEITPEEILVLREDARLVLSTLNEIQFQDLSAEEALCDEMLIECETLSLVSNESDSSYSTSEARDSAQHSPKIQPRPRIVKPLNRDAVRQHAQQEQAKADEKAIPKPIRGRRKSLYPRQQIISSFTATRFSSPRNKEMAVKPTRTSALRATQSQQKVTAGSRLPADLPPTVEGGQPLKKTGNQRSNTFVNNSAEAKSLRPLGRSPPMGHPEVAVDDFPRGNSTQDDAAAERPRPPIKQGTFTKDKPTHDATPRISPNKTRIPVFGSTPNVEAPPRPADVRPPRAASGRPTARLRMMTASRSLDESKSAVGGAVRCQSNIERKTPQSSSSSSRALSRRGNSSSPVPRGLSSSACSPRGISSPGVRNSPSTHSLGSGGGGRRCAAIAVNGKVCSLAGGGGFDGTKRSSSNGSLCSNSSSSTCNSRKSASCGAPGKKEVQSKVASCWKSDAGSDSRSGTPKEGMSRSSTYEKLPSLKSAQLPRHGEAAAEKGDAVVVPGDKEAKARDDGEEKQVGNAGQNTDKPLFIGKGTRALAEARLQKWLARKARLASKNSANQSADHDLDDRDGLLRAEAGQNNGASEGQRLSRTGGYASTNKTVVGEEEEKQQQQQIGLLYPPPTGNAVESRSPASAIVAPFNYTPSSQLTQAVSKPGVKSSGHRSLIPTFSHVSVSPSFRQREQFFNHKADAEEEGKNPCLVTTV